MHVDDTNQIAARQLPSSDKHTRRWAIRIPNTVEKQLYANLGSSAISEIRDITSPTTHAFQLKTDPATQETFLTLRVERNEAAPNRATLKIEVAGNTTIITIDAELASLLIGEKACSSEEIGDKAVTRGVTR